MADFINDILSLAGLVMEWLVPSCGFIVDFINDLLFLGELVMEWLVPVRNKTPIRGL